MCQAIRSPTHFIPSFAAQCDLPFLHRRVNPAVQQTKSSTSFSSVTTHHQRNNITFSEIWLTISSDTHRFACYRHSESHSTVSEAARDASPAFCEPSKTRRLAQVRPAPEPSSACYSAGEVTCNAKRRLVTQSQLARARMMPDYKQRAACYFALPALPSFPRRIFNTIITNFPHRHNLSLLLTYHALALITIKKYLIYQRKKALSLRTPA